MIKHSLIAVGLTFLSASAVVENTVYLHTPFNDTVQKIDMERCIANGKKGAQFQKERYVGQLLQLDFIWTMDETETCIITAILNKDDYTTITSCQCLPLKFSNDGSLCK